MKAWIQTAQALPVKAGWYNCKLKGGTEIPVPFVHNEWGIFVWLLPDPTVVTHWQTN